jgi:FKBP-type peptidyl-prolyl cis-trans isomerase
VCYCHAMLRPLAILLLLAAPAWADPLDLAANQAYLTAYAKRPGVVTKPSGLEYRVIRTSMTGHRPALGDTVRINFTGKSIDGKPFDGSAPSFPATLPLSTISVRGLNEALQMMHEGDHWELVVPANLGFGPKGIAGSLPPNQTLVFDVTLVQVIPAATAGGEQGASLGFYSHESGNSREAGATLTIPQ